MAWRSARSRLGAQSAFSGFFLHRVEFRKALQDFPRHRVQRRQLGHIHKTPPRVRHATDIHNTFAQLVVDAIPVALKLAAKTLQELPRSVTPAAPLKLKDHSAARLAKFPDERPVVAAGPFARLAGHRRFVGLKVASGQQLQPLGPHHRLEQAARRQNARR